MSSDLLSFFLAPFQYDFFRQAAIAGALIGILCPIVGSYLVVQRLTLLGNVISHAVLPGLVLANFWGIDILIGAFFAGTLSTGLMSWIQTQPRIRPDAEMALTLSTFFALGVVFTTLLDSRLNLEALLFGDLLSVTVQDTIETAVITAIVLCTIRLHYKELLFYTFDPVGAQAAGLPVRWLHLGLVVLVTLAIVASMKTVGVLLVVSMLIGPAVTAYLLVKELHWMMLLGAILGFCANGIGLLVSYHLDLPSGAAIAIITFLGFVIAFLWTQLQTWWCTRNPSTSSTLDS